MIFLSVLCFIITKWQFGETIQCYNCTSCSNPNNLVTCQDGYRQCIIAKGYLTNGTFQMARSCTDMADTLYDWTPSSRSSFNGVDYVNVNAKTCTSDGCNSDFVEDPTSRHQELDCYECVDCRTNFSNGSVVCNGTCFSATGLILGGRYITLRGCASSENSNFSGSSYFFQREFNGKLYSYVWMRQCSESRCNGEIVNFTNPFEADPHFDFIDDAVESSSFQIRLNWILIISIIIVQIHIFDVFF